MWHLAPQAPSKIEESASMKQFPNQTFPQSVKMDRPRTLHSVTPRLLANHTRLQDCSVNSSGDYTALRQHLSGKFDVRFWKQKCPTCSGNPA